MLNSKYVQIYDLNVALLKSLYIRVSVEQSVLQTHSINVQPFWKKGDVGEKRMKTVNIKFKMPFRANIFNGLEDY